MLEVYLQLVGKGVFVPLSKVWEYYIPFEDKLGNISLITIPLIIALKNTLNFFTVDTHLTLPDGN